MRTDRSFGLPSFGLVNSLAILVVKTPPLVAARSLTVIQGKPGGGLVATPESDKDDDLDFL